MNCHTPYDRQDKTQVGFIAALIVLAGAVMYGITTAAKQHIAERDSQIKSKSPFGVTFWHDGHLWTLLTGHPPIHGPKCPCQWKMAEAEETR